MLPVLPATAREAVSRDSKHSPVGAGKHSVEVRRELLFSKLQAREVGSSATDLEEA